MSQWRMKISQILSLFPSGESKFAPFAFDKRLTQTDGRAGVPYTHRDTERVKGIKRRKTRRNKIYQNLNNLWLKGRGIILLISLVFFYHLRWMPHSCDGCEKLFMRDSKSALLWRRDAFQHLSVFRGASGEWIPAAFSHRPAALWHLRRPSAHIRTSIIVASYHGKLLA